MEVKGSGKSEYESVSALELYDGTTLDQTLSILEYFGTTYNLKSQGRFTSYKINKF
jgi:hypothetical protein